MPPAPARRRIRPFAGCRRRYGDGGRHSAARSWLWTLLVTALAAGTRFWALGFPEGKSFDEVYYAVEAREMLRFGYEDNRGYMFIVHPPLGKWLIAVTSWMFGDDAVGWRAAPAIAGTVSVLILVRLAQRMFRSMLLGVLAGSLLALDGISLVMSRVALLDIFLQTFVLAGFAALVIDRDQLRARLGSLYAAGVDLSYDAPRLGPRPWRLAAGLLFGLALAVKWSALSYWLAFALLSVLWDRGALKSAGVEQPWLATFKRSVPAAIGSLLAVPVVAYLLSWTGWFVGENSWNRHWADTQHRLLVLAARPAALAAELPRPDVGLPQRAAHPHGYQSSPWGWLVSGRPVLFYYPSNPSPTGCGARLRADRPRCRDSGTVVAFAPAVLWACGSPSPAGTGAAGRSWWRSPPAGSPGSPCPAGRCSSST